MVERLALGPGGRWFNPSRRRFSSSLVLATREEVLYLAEVRIGEPNGDETCRYQKYNKLLRVKWRRSRFAMGKEMKWHDHLMCNRTPW